MKIKDFFPSKEWIRKIMEREKEAVKGTAVAILTRADGSVERHYGLNIVTDEGDLYYAQMGAGETPDTDFTAGGLRLGDDNTSPAKGDDDVTAFLSGTGKAVDANYPQTDDQDVDNTGAGPDIVTWRFSYGTGEGNAVDIIEGAIVDDIVTPTKALNHFLFDGAFTKTSADTLKICINHEFLGVASS